MILIIPQIKLMLQWISVLLSLVLRLAPSQECMWMDTMLSPSQTALKLHLSMRREALQMVLMGLGKAKSHS